MQLNRTERLSDTGLLKRAVALALVAVVLLATWLTFRLARQSDAKATVDTLATLATPATAVEQHPEYPDTALETWLAAIASSSRGHCSIMAKRLGSGMVARLDAVRHVPLLSVVKLPIAIVVMDGVDHGRWSLSTPVTLLGQDMHPRGELGDRFPRGGGPVSLYRLLVLMLTRSDNTAADALTRLAGGPIAVTVWMEQHGIHDLRVDRTERGLGNDWYGLPAGADTMGSAEGIRELRALVPAAVHDSAARAMLLDPRDTGSAQGCVNLLEHLWHGDLLSAAMTDTLKSVLARCKTAPYRLPGRLPTGTPVARKTGTGGISGGVTVAINDVGVIRMPDGEDVAIAVLVGAPSGPVRRSELLIARIARCVFDAWSVRDSSTGASRAIDPGGSSRPNAPR